MAIIVKTDDPAGPVKAIRTAIDDGEVVTWSYDNDDDFTHTTNQWQFEAWLKPKIYNGELRFGILKRNDTNLSSTVYAVYHGRFIE